MGSQDCPSGLRPKGEPSGGRFANNPCGSFQFVPHFISFILPNVVLIVPFPIGQWSSRRNKPTEPYYACLAMLSEPQVVNARCTEYTHCSRHSLTCRCSVLCSIQFSTVFCWHFVVECSLYIYIFFLKREKKRRKAKAISAELLKLNLKNKMEETGKTR